MQSGNEKINVFTKGLLPYVLSIVSFGANSGVMDSPLTASLYLEVTNVKTSLHRVFPTIKPWLPEAQTISVIGTMPTKSLPTKIVVPFMERTANQLQPTSATSKITTKVWKFTMLKNMKPPRIINIRVIHQYRLCSVRIPFDTLRWSRKSFLIIRMNNWQQPLPWK